MTTDRAAAIAAGYTVYRPKPGTAIVMRHGYQVHQAGSSGDAWAWAKRELARDRGRVLARQIRMGLQT